jgi:2-phospho-L-lactate/phosphoenolpyruvate guanylyltransferase
MPAAVLVPIKAFADAKVRLSPALSARERDALARRLARRVLAAAAPLPAFVVCDDEAVVELAADEGAGVLWTPGLGLDGAVQEGVARIQRAGFDRAVVAHADLPRVAGLAEFAGSSSGIVLAPDRRDDGTNVIAVPTGAGFRFAYGPGSFARHVAEAERLGLPTTIVRDDRFAWDVDLPADLEGLECG